MANTSHMDLGWALCPKVSNVRILIMAIVQLWPVHPIKRNTPE